MKKELALLLAAALSVGMLGCGSMGSELPSEESARTEEAALTEESILQEETDQPDEAAKLQAEKSGGSGEGGGAEENSAGEAETAGVEEDFRTDRPKVKGIYVTGPMAGTANMDELIALVERTELNAMVIDIKNDEGYVTFEMDSPLVQEIGSAKRYVRDMPELVRKCKEKDIYLIARIVAFRDPVLAEAKPDWCLHNSDGTVFRDRSGLAWVNPYEEQAWDYLLEVAEGAVELGFDEVQFDYVRFSTDSGMKQVDFGEAAQEKGKTEVITEFAAYAAKRLHEKGAAVSADVYGIVIDSAVDQQIVGQDYASLAEQLDYLSPMIYPSHYGANYYNIPIPDAQPYDTVLAAMQASKQVLAGVIVPKAETETDSEASVQADAVSKNAASEASESEDAAAQDTASGNSMPGSATTESAIGKDTASENAALENSASSDGGNVQLTMEEIAALTPMKTVRAGVRPWLQDFTATWVKGHIKYGAEQIREQIQAVYDAGYEEWILWNAANRYTEGGLYGADGQPPKTEVTEAAQETGAAEPVQETQQPPELPAPVETEEQGGT